MITLGKISAQSSFTFYIVWQYSRIRELVVSWFDDTRILSRFIILLGAASNYIRSEGKCLRKF